MARGGFDAIITNPPWDILKPNAKEFFEDHSELVSKKKMDIKAFEKEQAALLKDPEVRRAWLEYLSGFPHQSAYFRTDPGYANQISVVNGKKAGSDINLYKLFTERCFNLLRDGGQCGIVIPSGIYTDLGAKQLREMLFGKTQVTGLFGFENRRMIFEGVDSRFKFVVLSFTKGGSTESFPATFMRHETSDLELFPAQLGLEISIELISRLSPDSLSVMEFKNDTDVQIAEKMLKFPLLGEQLEDTWNLKLTSEFHMTNDSHLFQTLPGPGRLPLYEGKMINQFTNTFGEARYWIDKYEGRKATLGSRRKDLGQLLDYQMYRLGFRDIASNTNERTLISTLIPPSFHNNKLPTIQPFNENGQPSMKLDEQLFLCGVWNSFVLDSMLRLKVTTTVNFFYIYSLPVPRLKATDPSFVPVVERAAKLICTTPEFDDLAAEVGLGSHENGVTDPEERAALRAELDGMVAHLYGLTEEEFAYILTTFPLVDESVKTAALAAYNRLAPTEDDTDIARLIAEGESAALEFKSTARVNLHTGQADKKMEEVILKTVAGFWNADGGTLLIGVTDDGTVLGLEADYKTLGKKGNPDGYELFLTDLLLAQRLKFTGLLSTSFHRVGGKTVCKITAQPAPEPVWVTVGGSEHLYVRTNNSTRDLSGSDAYNYARRKWG